MPHLGYFEANARGEVDAALAFDAAARAAGRPEAANFEPIDTLRKAFLDNHPQPDRGQSPNAKTRKVAAAPAAACVDRIVKSEQHQVDQVKVEIKTEVKSETKVATVPPEGDAAVLAAKRRRVRGLAPSGGAFCRRSRLRVPLPPVAQPPSQPIATAAAEAESVPEPHTSHAFDKLAPRRRHPWKPAACEDCALIDGTEKAANWGLSEGKTRRWCRECAQSPGPTRAFKRLFAVNRFRVALLYGSAGRSPAKNGFGPGQHTPGRFRTPRGEAPSAPARAARRRGCAPPGTPVFRRGWQSPLWHAVGAAGARRGRPPAPRGLTRAGRPAPPGHAERADGLRVSVSSASV
jgi:hypothetical protein